MKEETKIERIINWFFTTIARYDCKKNRHRWGYILSKSGVVYLNKENVPPEQWICLECRKPKFPLPL